MKIVILTDRAESLKAAILRKVRDEEVLTWSIRKAKDDELLTHNPDQWYDKALLKLNVDGSRFEVIINWWVSEGEPNKEVKGIYLGRFVELLLNHFGDYLNNIVIEK